MLLVITRAVHIGACMILLSLFAFELLVARPALRETDRSASPHIEVLREQFRLLAVWSGFAAIVSGIVWFRIVLARITGGSLWEMPGIASLERGDHSNTVRPTVDMAPGSNAAVYNRELICATETPDLSVEVPRLAVCWSDYCNSASWVSCVGWARGSDDWS